MTSRVSTNSLRKEILSAVRGQIEKNDPPFVRQTLDRLVKAGQSEPAALHLISTAFLSVSLSMMRENGPFSNEQYEKLLNDLPSDNIVDFSE